MTFEPLKGVRVLDLSSVVVGPVCTARLEQYGAEVIKVESPEGDLMRGLGGISPTGQHSGTYLHLNRGKRNICCDLKKPSSRQLMRKLVESSEIIVANMRLHALTRLGLDPAQIRSEYPDKIYCLITGYGTDGPYAGHPTYDSVIQAVSGVAGLSLRRDGAPAYVPMLICDHVAGEIAAGSILAALLQQRATGQGCTIEVPMFETMAAFVLQEHLAQQSFDPPVGPAGDLRLLNAHNKPVRTADGWISFTVNTDRQVRSFLTAAGLDGLVDDDRFSTVAARARNVDEWFATRGAPLTGRTTSEWLEIFEQSDIPAKPCHSLETLPDDPHLQAVQLLTTDDHPTEGRILGIRPTIRFDARHSPLGSFAEPRGWQSRPVLEELGYSAEEIASLLEEGAVLSTDYEQTIL